MDNLIKNVLITGGAGFIGGNLIRRLLKTTSTKIYNLDKLSYCSDLSGINELLNTKCVYKNRYEFLNLDLANSLEVDNAINISNPDLVIHLAAESHVDRSIENPFNFIESNILGTYNLLQSTKKHWLNLNAQRKEIFKFLHVSTDEVFGSLDSVGFFKENTSYAPRSPYSASKASSDHLANAWHHTYGLPVIITNCSNNYGPWQFPEKLIPLTINKAISEEEIPLYGKGQNIRDWLFVEDHVDALIKTAKDGKVGEKYCVGGANEKTNEEVVKLICEILDHKLSRNNSLKNLIRYVKDRPGHDHRYAIDASKIKTELNWEPQYSFETGLEITINWYLENKNWCENVMKKSGYFGHRIGTTQ